MSNDVQKLTDEMENAAEHAFGCPHCGRDNILEVSTTLVSYPVTAWTEDGAPAAFGDPESAKARISTPTNASTAAENIQSTARSTTPHGCP